MLGTVLAIAAFVLYFVIVSIASERLPLNRRVIPYWRRPCAGRAWRVAFPEAPKQQIREYLQDFAAAFFFPEHRALCFVPQDRIMDVYRAVCRSSWSDGLELETFTMYLEDGFRVTNDELEAAWHEDISLGEVFRMTLKRE